MSASWIIGYLYVAGAFNSFVIAKALSMSGRAPKTRVTVVNALIWPALPLTAVLGVFLNAVRGK